MNDFLLSDWSNKLANHNVLCIIDNKSRRSGKLQVTPTELKF